jgi:hypothetical protein
MLKLADIINPAAILLPIAKKRLWRPVYRIKGSDHNHVARAVNNAYKAIVVFIYP